MRVLLHAYTIAQSAGMYKSKPACRLCSGLPQPVSMAAHQDFGRITPDKSASLQESALLMLHQTLDARR